MVAYVKDLCVSRVKTIESSQPLKNAARLMNNMGISSLIVTTDGKAVGIITERDMMRSIMLNLENLHKIPVRTFMSTELITIKENALIEDAIELMVSNRIKKLPVVSAMDDKGKLIGILSMTDIVLKYPQMIPRFNDLDNRTADLSNYPYLDVK
jgi:CBS domain-containing protein